MNLKLFYKFLIIKFKCYFDRSQNTYYSNRILNKNIDKVPAELGTLVNVKLPSMSVTVPIVVPFTNTDAPTTGKPSSSEVTLPVTFEI